MDLHQINVTGSHISYNAGGGIVSNHGNVRNLHITGCDIEGNMGDDDALPTANVLLVSGKGSIGEIAITGCTIQHDHNAKDSANIRIDLKSSPVSVTTELRHGNVTISGNVLSDTQTNIHLRNLRGAALTGNTIWKGYTENILLENCSAVTLSGNSMDRNFRYHYGDGKDAKLGVVLTDCRFCVLSGNILNGIGDRKGALETDSLSGHDGHRMHDSKRCKTGDRTESIRANSSRRESDIKCFAIASGVKPTIAIGANLFVAIGAKPFGLSAKRSTSRRWVFQSKRRCGYQRRKTRLRHGLRREPPVS